MYLWSSRIRKCPGCTKHCTEKRGTQKVLDWSELRNEWHGTTSAQNADKIELASHSIYRCRNTLQWSHRWTQKCRKTNIKYTSAFLSRRMQECNNSSPRWEDCVILDNEVDVYKRVAMETRRIRLMGNYISERHMQYFLTGSDVILNSASVFCYIYLVLLSARFRQWFSSLRFLCIRVMICQYSLAVFRNVVCLHHSNRRSVPPVSSFTGSLGMPHQIVCTFTVVPTDQSSSSRCFQIQYSVSSFHSS